ncbi:MAG: putative periplasmic linker protein [Ramlibacter sp.]|jgi:multidrug efflux system membrane fusion protein|nr:putative periplasmic linker protein [Ramlibacter sp.]
MALPSSRFFLLALSLCGASVLSGCSPAPAPQEPVRAVKVLTVGASSFQYAPEFAGEVKPRIESRLGFRVAGKLVRRQAEPGQRVRAGEVLAQLDPQDLRLAADAARAQVAAAQTNRELAAADFKRFATLKEQNFISGAELERRESTLKAAQAQLDQAQAQLSAQRNQAGYATLVADVAGVVTGIDAEPGQVVAAGSPVVRIAQDGPRDVVFSVPEDKVASVRAGSDVAVRVWASSRSLAGKVREVSASADPVTRTFSVKVSLQGADQPALGSTVSVSPLSLGHAGATVIKLPTSALRQEGGATAVWVLDKASMTLRSQPVQIATADGNEAVIAAGLQPGMLVVSAGVHVLSPGQKVTLYQDRQAPMPVVASQDTQPASTGSVQAGTLPAAAAKRP